MKNIRIFDQIKIAQEALDYIKKCFAEGDEPSALSLLKDFTVLLESIEGKLQEEQGTLIGTALTFCQNIQASLASMSVKPDKQKRIFNCEIYSLPTQKRWREYLQYKNIDLEGNKNEL